MMPRKKVIIWTIGIDDLKEGKGQVGGLTVQMMFWALAFKNKSFDVYSFTKNKTKKFDGISFLHFPQSKIASIVTDFIFSFYYIAKVRPNIILFRGASRSLFFLSYLSALFKVKLVFMAASDVNFCTGLNYIAGFHNRKLYHFGLRNTDYIVVQNVEQARLLGVNYKKSSITIPNIWSSGKSKQNENDKIIWIGNFRALKRPDWFVRLAARFPDQRFVMAGSPHDKLLFEHCLESSKGFNNLSILGGISFSQSERLFDCAKILICTSEYEGFPNTFLQAWSRKIPVLSTVNPSFLISKYNLGYHVESETDLAEKLCEILNDQNRFSEIQDSISIYFQSGHSSDLHFERLLSYIDCI